MPRCQCPSGCLCGFTADPPLSIIGQGSEGSPFIIRLDYGGKAGCDALVACVGEHVGTGLAYNPVTNVVSLKLSNQSGNTLSFGSDSGLMEADAPPPTPVVCGKTVAGLPSFVVSGNHGGAGLIKAYGARAGVPYVIDARLDMVEVDVQSTKDKIPCVSRFGYESQLATKTNMLGAAVDLDIEQVPVHAWTSALVANVQANGWPKEGGWYGFLEAEEYQWTLLEWLRALDAKCVAMVSVTGGAALQNETDNLTLAIAAVTQLCAEAWTMLQVGYLESVAAITAAGITPVVRVEANGAGNPLFTPAQVLATGATWVTVNRLMNDASLLAFKNAGLQVLWHTGSRQWQTQKAQSLGLRGIRCADPVYARGNTAEYRRNSDRWRLKRRQVGQLNSLTDGYYDFLNGYHLLDPANHALVVSPGAEGGLSHEGLQPGWCLPLPPAWSEYTIRVTGRPGSGAGSGSSFGLGICLADDRATGHSTPTTHAQPLYYAFVNHVAGSVGVFYAKNSGSSLLVSAGTPAFVNTAVALEVRVSATQIRFRRQVNPTTWTEVVTNNTDLRGKYLNLIKEEVGGSFEVQWSAFSVVQGIA